MSSSNASMKQDEQTMKQSQDRSLHHLDYLSVAIDLGTSNTVLAVCDSRENVVQVLSCGNNTQNPKLLRSVVGYHDNGKRLVGSCALDDIGEFIKGNTFYTTKVRIVHYHRSYGTYVFGKRISFPQPTTPTPLRSQRLLGRRYEEAEVQELLDGVAFKRNASKRTKSKKAQTVGGVQLRIAAKGHPCDYVAMEQVNAAIISHVLRFVERQYDGFTVAGFRNIWESPTTVVVVGVPANYDASQRNATRHSVEIAGIPPERIHLINEPTAAAIHHRDTYAASPPEDLTILVYDFGGGTIDVTIVDIGYNQLEWLERCREVFTRSNKRDLWKHMIHRFADDLHANDSEYRKKIAEKMLSDAIYPGRLPSKSVSVNVCAVEGNARLGGHDFTLAIVNLLLERLRCRCRDTYPGLSDLDMDRHLFDESFRGALYRKCEKAKLELSVKSVAYVLVHLRSLKTVLPDTAAQRIVRKMCADVPTPAARMLSKVYKVTTEGNLRAISLRLKRTIDQHTGMEAYLLQWPSRIPFKVSYSIDMVTARKIGVGVSHDAPDIIHMLRNDKKRSVKLSQCFWLRCDDGSMRSEESYCFYCKDQRSSELWAEILREVSGTPIERQRRRENSTKHEVTSGTILLEEIITRDEFECAAAKYRPRGTNTVRNLWTESVMPISESLNAARMRKEDIEVVLFVGGTTFIPKVRSLVKKELPNARFRHDRAFGAPVVAVASGAARYGSIMCSHMSGRHDMMVTEVISRSLGLKVKTKHGTSTMLHMVRKGEFLPFAHAAIFHPVHGFPTCTGCHCRTRCYGTKCKRKCKLSQEECVIEIFEGESEQCDAHQHNRLIGEFALDLTKFEPPVLDPMSLAVTIEFLLDSERVLTVSATALIDDEEDSMQISHRLKVRRTEDMVLTEREIRRMLRMEAWYVKVGAALETGEATDMIELDIASDDDEGESSEGVAFDSEDDELFRSPALHVEDDVSFEGRYRSLKDMAAII